MFSDRLAFYLRYRCAALVLVYCFFVIIDSLFKPARDRCAHLSAVLKYTPCFGQNVPYQDNRRHNRPDIKR